MVAAPSRTRIAGGVRLEPLVEEAVQVQGLITQVDHAAPRHGGGGRKLQAVGNQAQQV